LALLERAALHKVRRSLAVPELGQQQEPVLEQVLPLVRGLELLQEPV
jgi:hypothetical protein